MNPTDIAAYMAHVGVAARAASRAMAAAPTAAKDAALRALARRLRANSVALQAANAKDVAAAESAEGNGFERLRRQLQPIDHRRPQPR